GDTCVFRFGNTETRTRPYTDIQLASLEAEFILGDAAVSLEIATRTVRTAPGRALSADAVVVATGVRPRALPGQAGLAGVHVLRTWDDAVALRADLRVGARVVVVGDAVRGDEIAATARTMGVDVTLVGPGLIPMAAQLGSRVAQLLADPHTEHGVRLRPGAAVDGLTTTHRHAVHGVRLADGDMLPADVVVVAIGAVPVTEWLAGSGLVLDNGVVCDSTSRAAEGVYAVGDVARWRHDTPRCPSWRARRTAAASSPSTAGAAGSPKSLPGTCPSKPACTARLSSARPNHTH
ncbi:FAD-dependent oxidoreductase, partial [Streptomyces sp. NPDC002586]